MYAVARAWLGFFALGAGLIHLALVIGSPVIIGIPVALVGIAEFTWGVFAVTAPTIPFARVARIASIVPILGWATLILLPVGTALPGVRVMPMLIASLLDLAVAVTITMLLRRAPDDARPIRSGRYLIGLGAGALVVAALTMPALAATEAGNNAQTHGTQESPNQLDLPERHPCH